MSEPDQPFSYRPDEPAGVHVANVTAWFAAHLPHFRPPFGFTLIAGGHSNLTYQLTDADGQRCVLRRPPLGHVLATAHDMTREYRAIHALGPTPVPVPQALGLCTDVNVNGAPFYVMGYVAGWGFILCALFITFDVIARRFFGFS